MYFDEIFEYIGHFGLYQILLILVLGIVSFIGGTQAVAMNVLAPNVDHWCQIPRLRNFTFDQQKYIAIPYEKTQTGQWRYSQCYRYTFDFTNLTDRQLYHWNRTVMNLNATTKCTSWTFDQSQFASSAVSQVHCGRIYCDRVI